jgi:hypothetical protein
MPHLVQLVNGEDSKVKNTHDNLDLEIDKYCDETKMITNVKSHVGSLFKVVMHGY